MPDPDLRKRPTLRHVFQLADGDVLIVPHRDAHRTLDKRSDRAPTETVWEVLTEQGLRRVWPSDLIDWSLEEL